MTTIETIRCHRVSAPLHSPFVTALRTATSADSLLVEVVDSDGASGWGEAPQVWQVTGESFAGAQAAVEGPISAAIIGRDSADLTEVLRWVQASTAANHGAKAAADARRFAEVHGVIVLAPDSRDDLCAVGSAVDVVAEQVDGRRVFAGVGVDPLERGLEQLELAVHVSHGVPTHRAYAPPTARARNQRSS